MRLSACAVFRLADPPDLHPVSTLSRACARGGPSTELRQPDRLSRPLRPLERLSTLRAAVAAFGSVSVSAFLFALRLGLGLRFGSASRRFPEPEGPLFRREKQAVRLGFVITLTRLCGLTIGPSERAVLEPVQDRCITLENRRY